MITAKEYLDLTSIRQSRYSRSVVALGVQVRVSHIVWPKKPVIPRLVPIALEIFRHVKSLIAALSVKRTYIRLYAKSV